MLRVYRRYLVVVTDSGRRFNADGRMQRAKAASIPCFGQRRQHLVCANVATACNCVCTRLSLCASVPLGLCASEIVLE